MSADGARIVLVKPGDVLILGNVGVLDEDDIATLTEALDKLKDSLGLDQILVFEADIDLAAQVGRADDATKDTVRAGREDGSPDTDGPLECARCCAPLPWSARGRVASVHTCSTEAIVAAERKRAAMQNGWLLSRAFPADSSRDTLNG